MRIYLAARYSRRDELRGVADCLRAMGHVITSSWLETDWPVAEGGSSAAPPEQREAHACRDLADVRLCECCVSFTEPPRSGGRGGRHVEYGYALALGRRLIVVGPRENVFHHLPAVHVCATAAEMLAVLAAEGRGP